MTTNLPWITDVSSDRLKTVRDMSLGKVVKDDVLRLILAGVLVPGQRINEPEVANRLQISRVPVREALRELESSGLVVSRKNAGVFVRELDATEIRDLYQMRGLLDGFAGRCVANLPEQQRNVVLSQLDESIVRMQLAAKEHSIQAYYSENLKFHWLLVEAVGNQQLTETYRGVVQKLHLSRLKNLSTDFGIAQSIAEHVEIVKSLRTADASVCDTLMAHHVSDAYVRFSSKTSQET